MKGTTTMTGSTGTPHSTSKRSLAPLAHTSFVLALAVAICLATATVAFASVPETGNQWVPAAPSQGDVTKAKTGADTNVGQNVPAPVQAPASTASSGGSNGALVVGIALAVAAACALIVFGWRRRSHPRAVTVSSLPGPAAAGQHTKAA